MLTEIVGLFFSILVLALDEVEILDLARLESFQEVHI